MAVRARRLAARSPRYEHDLTSVLLLLAQRQVEAGRPDDALATLAEAVQVCRRRADGESARFEPNLAAALRSRSLLHAELGRWEHALSAAEQAVDLYRRLMPGDPERFEPRYANALDQFGICLSECDRLEEAVPVAERAVRIVRRLSAGSPDERLPDLARCVQNLGALLIDARRFEEGLHATEEAIRLRRRLDRDEPGRYETVLADLLRNRDLCLTTWTRHVAEQAAPDEVVLGPYPLCDACKQVNGGLVAVRHRQVHVRAHGKESCVDQGLAGIMAGLWAVCDTTTCCEDEDGRAYVAPVAGQAFAAEEFLAGLGIRVENEGGALYFALPSSAGSYRMDSDARP
ncbi:tetratricopeptide repeat protein [Saccharothrix sp. ALI-22-I]|uniref:tetratricopeptide repeat protein n=1 Tax=Saccharothrix sp. ALI-22-I TaxID=1933778 RepID=UPI0015C313EA|nr:tetratricopeptide repeat protein [Saccharothrix sp. ALI-22-I]